MTPLAPHSTSVKGGINTSDPRIMSPDIKVIYPSESATKELQISEQQTTAPVAQVLPTSPLSEIEAIKESKVITQEIPIPATPPQTTTSVTPESTKVSSWKDTLKEHAGLFIAVALISIGIGVLIGKKI